MARTKSPRKRREWQEAVDAATYLLLLNDARLYGLIEGGPEIDVARCEEVLELGRERGIYPRPRRCRMCGCTDDAACEGGCYWVGADLCSRCAGFEKMRATR